MKKLLTIALAAAVVSGSCASNNSNKESVMEKNETKTRTVIAKELTFNTPTPTIAQIDSAFKENNIEFNAIDCVNWDGFSYTPDVKFAIAYSKDEIYIQYLVTENDVKAVYDQDQGSAPYKDSCVEFFCIPGEGGEYYNLELNCIGKGTFAGGAKRTERTKYGQDVLDQIRREATLGNKAFGIKTKADNNGEPYTWKVTAAIPVKLYALSDVAPLKGRTIKANFYKCGDDMPSKHYLSWNPIGTEKPNFHTPDYFGDLKFE